MSLWSALVPREAEPGPEASRPAGPPPLGGILLIGLAGTVLATFVSYLDTRLTSFSVADLQGGLAVGSDEASWVSNAYNIAEAAVVPMTPWLAGIVSPRRAIAASLALLTVAGAAVPLFGEHYTLVVAARFVQGLGGGALVPLLLSTLLRFLPLHQRIIGFAFYALVTTATPLLAELLSGVLTENFGWRSVFYVGVAIGPVIMVMVLTGLPVEPAKPQNFAGTDYAGMAFITGFSATLTAALGEGQRLDWFDSPLIVSLFVASALLLAGFVLREMAAAAPLIDLRILNGRNIVCGLLMVFPFSLEVIVTANVLPQYGIVVRGFRELQIGEVLIWAALLQILVCLVAPFVYARLDARIVTGLGLTLAALGCRAGTYISSAYTLPELLPSTLLVAAGQPLIMIGLLLFATSTLKPAQALAGGTLFNIVRTLAGSLGGAIVSGVLTVRERVHSAVLVEHFASPGVADTPFIGQAGAALAGAARVQATVMATADAYGLLGVVAIAAMLIAMATHEIRKPRAPAS